MDLRVARGRLAGLEPVAVVDIGSNSVRLVVYEGERRCPTPLYNEKVLAGLGRTLSTSHRLDDAGLNRAYDALKRFRAIAENLGAPMLHVVATAAARDADNGPEFIGNARAICGCEIEVLTGEREAQLAAAGLMSGVWRPDGLGGDLGGGSLELFDVHDGLVRNAVSLPVGSLRLIDAAGGNLKEAGKIVEAELDTVEWLGEGAGRTFYAIGGTWRALARLHMAHIKYPLSVIHGYTMRREEALTFTDLLDHLSPSSLEGIKDISSARRETVPYGALVLDRLLRRARPADCLVSLFGIREGLHYSLLPDEERQRDPLIAGCEDLSILEARSPESAREMFEWTSALFVEPGPEETPEQKRLRHAVCLLADVRWRAHPDFRGEQSLSFIADGSFVGVDHAGRAFMALAVYYRHEGLMKEANSPAIASLLDKDMMKRARIVGAAIRAGHVVTGGAPGILDQTRLSYRDGALVLTLPGHLSMLDGERVERRFGTLAKELDCEGVIETGMPLEKAAG